MTPNSASFADASANGLPAETQYQDHLPQIRHRHNSKERRLEPQITIGLLTDASGFPLAVEAFEGNKAETATTLPVINAFKTAHQLTDGTVVADAGIISEANQISLQASGLSFILGTRIPFVPDVVREWRDKLPDDADPQRVDLHPAVAGHQQREGPRHPGSGRLLPVPP